MFGHPHKQAGSWRLLAGSVVVSVALALLLAPGSAGATTKSFKSVQATKHLLAFKVRGVDAQRIVDAMARMRSRGRSKKTLARRLSVSRVRSAASRRRLLKVRKPRSVRRGKLTVRLDNAKPGPPGGETSCAWGSFSANSLPGACWRPYADSSPFNTPVAGMPDAPNSDAIVAGLMDLSPIPDKIVTGNSDTAGDWAHPIYFSQPSDPLFTVDCTEDWGTCETEGMQVRIPDEARPAGGSDAHLAVIDQQAGWEYDFWQVRSKPAGGGTLTVSWGGRTRIGTPDADGRAAGATASHFGLAAGVIRPAELAAGEINHALFSVVKCTNGTSVLPALRGTGTPCASIGRSNANAPAMGQHFYLDMSESEINALDVPEWQKTILRALAEYGTYVGDTGGGGWTVMFESGSSYTSFGQPDPWIALGDRFGAVEATSSSGRSLRVWDFGRAVDWASELEVAAP